MSEIIGELFISFKAFPKWILVLILSTLTATFTEVTSNVATATIFLPILAELVSSNTARFTIMTWTIITTGMRTTEKGQ